MHLLFFKSIDLVSCLTTCAYFEITYATSDKILFSAPKSRSSIKLPYFKFALFVKCAEKTRKPNWNNFRKHKKATTTETNTFWIRICETGGRNMHDVVVSPSLRTGAYTRNSFLSYKL